MNRVGVAGLLFGVACGPQLEVTEWDDTSLVTRAVFDRAASTISSIDYLPYQYALDGCYARALYMAAELAAVQIESNSIFAFANPAYPLVFGQVRWDYHVATMLVLDNRDATTTQMVIDPGISAAPLMSHEWLVLMGHDPSLDAPHAFPELLTVPGSRYGILNARAEATWANRDVSSFLDMPNFRTSDLQDACTTMSRYLGLEGGANVTTRRQRLQLRTTELLEALGSIGKLDADITFSPLVCAALDE